MSVGGNITVRVAGQALAVSITLPSGRLPSVTVGGAAVVSMPYTIAADTTFVVTNDNEVLIVVTAGGQEVYRQSVQMTDGRSWIVAPTDSYIGGKAAYVAVVGTTATIPSPASYGMSDLTLTADCTLAFPTPVAGRTFTLFLRQDQVGGHAVTWPTGVSWATGAVPTLSTVTTSGKQNLLTANQSSVETDTTGLSSAAYPVTTLARSTATFENGSACASLTRDASATGSLGVATPTGTSGVAVTEGQRYTAVASVKAAVTGRASWLYLKWYNSAGVAISQTYPGPRTSSTSAWTKLTITGVAPEGAAYASIAVVVVTTTNGEVHYVDSLGIWASSTPPYLLLSGSSGSYAFSADSNAFPTGDIDVRVKAALTDWTPSAAQALVAKYSGSGGGESFSFVVHTDGTLKLNTSAAGTSVVTATSSVAPAVVDGADLWVRVTRNATTGVAKFYTSSDGSTWTQLGTQQATTAGGIYDSTSILEIGSTTSGTANNLAGKVYRVQILDGTGDTAFDADFTRQEGESFTESSRNAAYVAVYGRAVWAVGGVTAAAPEVVEFRSDGTYWYGQRPVTIAGLDARYLGMPLALTGATAATRYVGATASGNPASGTFAVGDLLVTQDGKVKVCTNATGQGTWVTQTVAADLASYLALTNSSPATVTGQVLYTSGLQTSLVSAPADGTLAAGQAAIWLDATNAAGKLMVKAKTADGTVVTGSVTLS